MAARRSAKWRREWAQLSAWTPSEFAQLCLGWAGNGRFGDAGVKDIALYHRTLDKIGRAIRTKDPALPVNELMWPPTAPEVMYASAPLFRPAEVWRWALERFPRFPFREADFPSAPAGDPALPERLRMVTEIARQIAVGNRAGVSQKQIADEIKNALRVSKRDAEAYAALVRPDKDVTADRRAARRRT